MENIKIMHRGPEKKALTIARLKELWETTNLTIESMKKVLDREGLSGQSINDKNYIPSLYTKEQRLARKSKNYARSKIGTLNPMTGKIGELHHGFKGVISDGMGYLMVLKPEWYTGRKGSTHVFHHSVIMCEALDLTEIPKGFCVHHIDLNPLNNDLSNLCLMSLSAHMRLHQILNTLGRCNDYSERK